MTILEGVNFEPCYGVHWPVLAWERSFEGCCISSGKRLLVNMTLPVFGGSVAVTKQTDVCKPCVCSPSQSRVCHCGCFHDLPD